ncbi:hypothetical protein E3E12_03315 [Formicincola oecophyllae]|uniref:Uncharacterized protein n=1 Tax=Formicincola oecophyllae TaxID=2558361 RepID=A0A4Y6U7T0_9PROT|nr:hypothetical protein [Formicincola oecophyllae]QDH13392.1 hypothetical protein E3E12_03315 [Formicincola oecophyllae]
MSEKVPNAFGCLLKAAGLSRETASIYLEVSPKTLAQWLWKGVKPPHGVLTELNQLIEKTQQQAELLAEMDTIPVSLTEEQAQQAGWPGLDTERHCLGMALAKRLQANKPLPTFVPAHHE